MAKRPEVNDRGSREVIGSAVLIQLSDQTNGMRAGCGCGERCYPIVFESNISISEECVRPSPFAFITFSITSKERRV